MRRFIRSKVIVGLLIIWGSYWVFAPLLLMHMRPVTLFTAIIGLLMALWVGILISYWQSVWRSVRDANNPLGGRMVITGIATVALGLTGLFAWALAAQYFSNPPWMRTHMFRGFIYWVLLSGATYLLIAGSGNIRDSDMEAHWWKLGTGMSMAIIGTLALVYTIGGID